MEKGDKTTIGKWIKSMGHQPTVKGGKPRNLFALCKKGKLVPVILCEKEEAEAVVQHVDGRMTPYKRVPLSEEVIFGVTIIDVLTSEVWKKATTKNVFLGLLNKPGEKDGLDT